MFSSFTFICWCLQTIFQFKNCSKAIKTNNQPCIRINETAILKGSPIISRSSCDHLIHGSFLADINEDKTFVPNCPETSGPYEHGIPLNYTALNLEVPEKLTDARVAHGGHWSPTDCVPQTNPLTLVVIAMRSNRNDQLSIFLTRMHPFLQQQQIKYSILVVNQADDRLFNRAALFNIGYVTSRHLNYDCYIFTDVDMIPEVYDNQYKCDQIRPKHLSSAPSNWDYELPYVENFGGVTAFTRRQFEAVNGFSNMYWGWGGEDDDMYLRVLMVYGSISRSSGRDGRTLHLSHSDFKRAPINIERKRILLSKYDFSSSGLNSLHKVCSCTKSRRFNLYTRVDAECRQV